MQLISLNPITQGRHGAYNAVDIDNEPDPFYYAPEDGVVTVVDNVDDDTCGKRLKLRGAHGEHGFCHNDTILVKAGDAVLRGQKLAKMGYTGYTVPDNVPAGAHVHWVLNRNGVWTYPLELVDEAFIKLEGGTMADLGALADLRLATINKLRQDVGLNPRTDTNTAEDITERVKLAVKDADNVLNNVGIKTPDGAAYEALGKGPKDFLYWYSERVKAHIATLGTGNFEQVGTIDGVPIFKKKG